MTRPELRRQAASRRPTSEDNDVFFPAHFVKSVEELPYNNSVIHINAVLASAVNLIRFMSAHGCKVFAGDEGGAAADVGVQGGTSGIIMPESFEQSPLQSPPTPLKRRANALSRWSFHVARISLCDSFPFSCWNEFPSDLYLSVLLISLVWSLGNPKSISTSSGSSDRHFQVGLHPRQSLRAFMILSVIVALAMQVCKQFSFVRSSQVGHHLLVMGNASNIVCGGRRTKGNLFLIGRLSITPFSCSSTNQ